jgi:hypothetical protein
MAKGEAELDGATFSGSASPKCSRERLFRSSGAGADGETFGLAGLRLEPVLEPLVERCQRGPKSG